jgi:hypothetical protein
MSVTDVTVNGQPIDLGDVEYAIQIYQGRNDIASNPTPSNIVISIYVTGMDSIPYGINQTITVDAYDVRRFTGRITDIRVLHLPDNSGTPTTKCEIYGVGSLAILGATVAGTSGFSAEDLQTRVDSILGLTGQTYVTDISPGISLNAYDPVNSTAGNLLDELCLWCGATYFDTTDGEIWFESYTRRGLTYSNLQWQDSVYSWADTDGTWDEQLVPGALNVITLPGNAVVWEPVWTSTSSTIINEATISYGTSNPQDTYTATDSASIVTYGYRSAEITTGLANLADAQTRAGTIITAQADERWQVGQIDVYMDYLDAATHAAMLQVQPGARILLTDLPQPSPWTEFLGVVEGYGETFDPIGHRMTLSLSDPRYSNAGVSWGEAPTAATWATIPASNTWADIIVPGDLI